MRKTIYSCDSCERTLSDEDKIQRPHISVNFASPSGWVSNHAENGNQWRHDSFTGGIFQFCNPTCLARHFTHLAHQKLGKAKPKLGKSSST